LLLVAAVIGNWLYTQAMVAELRWEMELMEQHLQTDVDVVERELEAKLVQRVFEQKR
jgi:hypothetical protein